MKKYKIAWLPGDGIGTELSVLAKKVLDVLQLGVEYVNADIGWEFWKKEGNPLPSRTIKVLNETDCGFLVSITSKSNDDAQLELNNELKNLNLKYISPIVQLRKKFQLHTNIRPCFSFSGNINNLKENIDLVIFRENTEGMYSGVEDIPDAMDVSSDLNRPEAQVTAPEVDIPMDDDGEPDEGFDVEMDPEDVAAFREASELDPATAAYAALAEEDPELTASFEDAVEANIAQPRVTPELSDADLGPFIEAIFGEGTEATDEIIAQVREILSGEGYRGMTPAQVRAEVRRRSTEEFRDPLQ